MRVKDCIYISVNRSVRERKDLCIDDDVDLSNTVVSQQLRPL